MSGLEERLLEATVGTLELFGVHLGTRLGLYRALRHRGELTSGELSAVAGISERYAREWLEQQAVAGLLTVDDVAAPAAARRYRLPVEHVGPLADPDDPAHVAPLADMVVGIAGALPDVVAAYRDGGGVPYPRDGPKLWRGQGGIGLTATRLPAGPGRTPSRPPPPAASASTG